jgi:hypothetical protein
MYLYFLRLNLTNWCILTVWSFIFTAGFLSNALIKAFFKRIPDRHRLEGWGYILLPGSARAIVQYGRRGPGVRRSCLPQEPEGRRSCRQRGLHRCWVRQGLRRNLEVLVLQSPQTPRGEEWTGNRKKLKVIKINITRWKN